VRRVFLSSGAFLAMRHLFGLHPRLTASVSGWGGFGGGAHPRDRALPFWIWSLLFLSASLLRFFPDKRGSFLLRPLALHVPRSFYFRKLPAFDFFGEDFPLCVLPCVFYPFGPWFWFYFVLFLRHRRVFFHPPPDVSVHFRFFFFSFFFGGRSPPYIGISSFLLYPRLLSPSQFLRSLGFFIARVFPLVCPFLAN